MWGILFFIIILNSVNIIIKRARLNVFIDSSSFFNTCIYACGAKPLAVSSAFSLLVTSFSVLAVDASK